MTVVTLQFRTIDDPLDVTHWRNELVEIEANVWAVGDGAEVSWWTEDEDHDAARRHGTELICGVVGRTPDHVEVLTDEEFEQRVDSMPEVEFGPSVIVDRYWGI